MPSKKNKPSRKLKKTKKARAMRGHCNKCRHSKTCQCAACKYKKRKMKGGSSFYKPATPIPGPFVGQPWGAAVHEWPGENGMGADRNYLSQNMYFKDPQTMMKLGGKKIKTYKKKRRRLNSTKFNKFRKSISFNAGSIYNTLNGYAPPVNPAPYEQQLPNAGKQILI